MLTVVTVSTMTCEAPSGPTPRDRGNGVNDGTRTRDRQGHNLELYQLSYVHHAPQPPDTKRPAGRRPAN